MRKMNLFSCVFLFVIVLSSLAEPSVPKKLSSLRHPAKTSRGTATPQSPSRLLQVNRCAVPRSKKVWIKLKGGNTPAQEYGFIEFKGEYVYYCVGEYERAGRVPDLGGIFFEPPASAQPQPTPMPISCPQATGALKANILFNPIPADPMQNQGRDFPETVALSIEFRADGKIGNVGVLSNSPRSLVESAKRAAQKIIFDPAQENGRNICVTQQYDFEFPKRMGINRPTVALVSPVKDETLRNPQGKIRFSWRPVPDINIYVLEVQYKTSLSSYDWHPLPELFRELNNSHEVSFPWAVPGRWRVTAELLDGSRAFSEWREFRIVK